MKTSRKVLIATKSDDFRISDRSRADGAGIEIAYAPQRALGALNGKALELSALVIEIDARDPDDVRAFEALAGAKPERKVIAAAPEADSGDVRRLFRAGAADVLTGPMTDDGLVASLLEVLTPTPAPAASGRGQVIAVLGAAAGAGATTTTLNLARLLSREGAHKGSPRRSTAVLDLDLQFGNTELALNLDPRSGVLEIIRAQGRFDSRFLQSVLTEHESGLNLLAPPPALLPLEALSPALAAAIVDASARLHRLTVVDLPAAWTDWTLEVLKHADLIVLMAPATIAGVGGARRMLDALREGQVTTPVLFALSQLAVSLDALDKPARISRALELEVAATLALDPNATRAGDRGKLVVDAFPNSRLSKDLRGLAARVEEKLAVIAPVAAQAGDHP